VALIQGVLVGSQRNPVDDDRFNGQFIDIQLQRGGRVGRPPVSSNGEFCPDQRVVFEQRDIEFNLADEESRDGVIFQIDGGGCRWLHHGDYSSTNAASPTRGDQIGVVVVAIVDASIGVIDPDQVCPRTSSGADFFGIRLRSRRATAVDR